MICKISERDKNRTMDLEVVCGFFIQARNLLINIMNQNMLIDQKRRITDVNQ